MRQRCQGREVWLAMEAVEAIRLVDPDGGDEDLSELQEEINNVLDGGWHACSLCCR